ncbi:condensation domain-containing protein, partial [Pseudomonas sp. RIT-To-2]|uniref:condensation domain-containing protein n=1 Tax=Pseudomonas sp. RIT-To-2 TaxID=3462541 RepID=UPI002413602E
RQAGIHFTPKQLFQHQTVQGLAAVARVGEQGGVQIDQGPVTGQALLLPIQQWFFEQDIPDRHHWNQSLLLTPGQRLEASVLEQALQALVAHHDALRLGFEQRDHGTWQAYYHAQGGQPEPLVWQAVLPEVAGLKSLCDKAQRSLALGQGPLIRAVLAEVGDDEQRLLLVIHHLVVDGVSWRILLQDLQTVYAQLQAGQPIVLPAKTSSTKAWAEHMQAHANSDTLRQEREQWASSLAGTNPELPCKNPLGSQQGRHAARAHTRLDSTLTRQLLQQAPAAYRTRINDLLLTALARVIGRWTEHDDVLVQLEGHGREELFDDVDLTRTVGWFTSLYPVRLNPVGSMADSIKHIKEQLRAVPNQGIGFGALRYLGDTAAREALARLPVPRITFNYLGQLDAALADPDAGGVDAPFLRLAQEGTGDSQSLEAPLSNWLTLNGQVQGGELILGWSFSREVFDEQTIQRLADEYAAELALLVGHCLADDANGLTPSDVPLAGLDQRQLDSLATVGMEDIYPLSPMQQGMLFHSLYEQQTGSYINQLRVDVQGLDVQRFHDAWQQAVDAHDVLRARFLTGFEQALQVVDKQVAIAFSSQDWSGRPDVAMALDTWAQADRRAGFDLHAGPLLRMAAFKIDDDRHHLVYTSHHILMDGWSNSQLLGEVLQRYAGQVQVVKATPYRDYIQWLQQQDAARSEAFWLQQLEPLQAPTRLAPAMRQDKA